MIEISEELFFYHNQYKTASIFAEYTECSDLIEDFEKLKLQYLQYKDERLFQKFEDNIKSFYRRGLPEWFRFIDDEIKRSEGKYFDYIDVRQDLLRIRKKFDLNNLELKDYNDLLTEYKKLDSNIKIKKSMEKFQEKQNWKFLLLSVVIGFLLGLGGSFFLKFW